MDLQAIEARLEAAENVEDFPLEYRVAAKQDFHEHAPEDMRALLDEVKAVRDAVARHPDVMECSEYSDDEPVSCGWKRAYEDVVWALNGGKE